MKKSATRLRGWRFGAACAAALFITGALTPATFAFAQETTAVPPGDDEIVVEGIRDRRKVIDKFVRGLTVASPDQPLARYAGGEYCPAVLGLSEQRNAQMALRMRAVATAVGVDPAKQGCAPSALVFFVADKDAFVREFRKRHPTYFTDLQGGNRFNPRGQGPALAWHLVQLVDPQGMPVDQAANGSYNVVESSAGGSRLLSMVTSVVAMSVVIVERSALLGLTPTQIADYALMRTLTDRDPKVLNVPRGVSILSALGAPMGTAVPSSLTEWDLAYLKGRYSGDPARFGASQGAAIRNSMRRALAENAEK